MTLSVSEMKTRLETYLTFRSMDAVGNADTFRGIAEDERLPSTLRRKAEESYRYHCSRVTTYDALIVELRSGNMDHIFSR